MRIEFDTNDWELAVERHGYWKFYHFGRYTSRFNTFLLLRRAELYSIINKIFDSRWKKEYRWINLGFDSKEQYEFSILQDAMALMCYSVIAITMVTAVQQISNAIPKANVESANT